jgi:hypothetical protein
MRFSALAFGARRLALAAAVTAVTLVAAGCSDNNGTGPSTPRMFNQIQRLGNPLISEVLLSKRSHGVHGALGPDQDSVVAPEILSFITGPNSVAGRSADYAAFLGSVLLPDMLIVQTDKPATTAGYLSWALADGFGGRLLTDDVVDVSLSAVFGDPLGKDPAGAQGKEALTTDNVSFDSPGVTTTFPYLAPPN